MSNFPTPHIEATSKEEIASTVLMPGDPLRAKFIAENFLENAECFNKIRGMLGFTGTYKNKKVSVMGSGMGMPSIGIYSYELFNFYDVQNIIRIGSAGAINTKLNLKDIVFAAGACTDSNYASQYGLGGIFSPIASFKLLSAAQKQAENLGLIPTIGNILSSDIFYQENTENTLKWNKMGVLAVEMEAAALYKNAARANKNALCIVTISDLIYDFSQVLSAEERQTGFLSMVEIALETAISTDN